jgi:FKBP-type peptidyl-prolyl cis-trans isomerase
MLVDGRVFDSSRRRNAPYQFTHGSGKVISGFDEGLVGMKVNGRRILTLPANLAFGNNPPAGTTVPKGATVIFEVELVAVQA